MNKYEILATLIAIVAMLVCGYAIWRQHKKLDPMRRDREKDRVRREMAELKDIEYNGRPLDYVNAGIPELKDVHYPWEAK